MTAPSLAPTGRRVIALDFDGTVIRESSTTRWLVRLLLREPMPLADRLALAFSGFWRGIASLVLSRSPRHAETAVRLAFGAFRGMPARSLGDLALAEPGNGPVLTPNPALFSLLARVAGHAGAVDIAIYSQGAAMDLIHAFLTRPDVARRFASLGIEASRVAVFANHPETAPDGRLTGRLSGRVWTKHNRTARMSETSLFIGDRHDALALARRDGRTGPRFIDWRTESSWIIHDSTGGPP